MYLRLKDLKLMKFHRKFKFFKNPEVLLSKNSELKNLLTQILFCGDINHADEPLHFTIKY
jgi:hypothetical protein